MIEINVQLEDDIFDQLTEGEHDKFLSTSVVNEAISAATDLAHTVNNLEYGAPSVILGLAVVNAGLGRMLLNQIVPDHERSDVIFAAIQKAARVIHDAMIAHENPPQHH